MTVVTVYRPPEPAQQPHAPAHHPAAPRGRVAGQVPRAVPAQRLPGTQTHNTLCCIHQKHKAKKNSLFLVTSVKAILTSKHGILLLLLVVVVVVVAVVLFLLLLFWKY